MASYQLVTAPATEPLTLSEAKAYLRVDSTDEDTLITSLIVSARQYVEARIWRPLITQTWAMWLDKSEVNSSAFNINKAPISSISSVNYYDTTNNLVTLAASNYEYDLYSNPVRFRIINVPNIYDKMNALNVTFVAGYGNAASVPEQIKEAMKLVIANQYENRQEEITGSITSQFVQTADKLLQPYRNSLLFT